MKSMMKKTALREVKETFGRFAAILAIIALGVGFFSGVRITTPAMVNMMNDFIQEKQLYDLRLISTLGWEDEDVSAFAQKENVRFAEGANSVDAVFLCSGNEVVLKTHSITDNLNGFKVVSGRLPEKPNECLADADSFMDIRDRIILSDENSESTLDSFTENRFKVVGLVDSSCYINFERGTTSIGNGSISGFLYLPKDSYNLDYYSEIFVKFDNDDKIYSDEYNDFIDGITETWEDNAKEQADIRYERIISSAYEEINDGKAELEDKRLDGQKELDDAQKELKDADKKLKDAEKELKDAENEINDGQKELDDAKTVIDDGKAELDKAEKQLADSKKQLDDAYNQLIDGKRQLDDGQIQIDNGYEELYTAQDELAKQENALAEQEKAFYEQYGQALAVIDSLPPEQQTMLKNGLAEIENGKAKISDAKEKIYSSFRELEHQQNVLNEKTAEYETAKNEYENGRIEYRKGLNEFNNAKKEYENGLKEYEDGLKEFEDGRKKYEDGKKEYEDGKKEYSDGLKEYNSGLSEFDEKIADAEKEIADAEEEIADIEKPDVFVLNRNTNIGYACFENDSEIVEQVARVFPVFFILVAALVCMTTMSRMVEEQRTQIGMFKALGYSEGSVMGKFMFYSGSAALTGCITGYAAGTALFPAVIWMTYKLMYIPLDIPYLFDWKLALTAVAVSLLCSIGTTWLTVRKELKETAANLMRPKAPKAGKRVILERIPFIWNHLKFLHKVSVRNIFRYKGRLFMMVVGIGGCTALLLTGFGLKDSIAGFAEIQYGEIQISDASVSFKSDENRNISDELSELLNEKTADYLAYSGGSWDLVYGNRVKGITLQAFESFDNMDKYMNFHDNSGNPIDYPKLNEALVSHSIAERYGAETGKEIVLRDENMNELKLMVKGIFENHVYNYVFISAETMESQLDRETEFNGALINFPDSCDIYKTSAAIAKNDSVTNVTVFEELKTRMSNMMSSLNYIVLLVIACAAGLAFVVIYNLTNINITERVREIATIKVLGFFRRETSAYVLRENLVLTGIGVIAGLGLGILLHRFVMAQIVVDMVDFSARIQPISFVFSVILTFVFNFIVNIFMEIKLEKINMAESLKSVD